MRLENILIMEDPRQPVVDLLIATYAKSNKSWTIRPTTDPKDGRRIARTVARFPVIVRVKIGENTYEQQAWLSQLLENSTRPAIQAATQRIKVN